MEDAIMGEGDEAGGAGLGASLEDWADDDEVEVVPHRQPALDHQGAGPSAAPAARGGAQKRWRVDLLRQPAEEIQGFHGGDQAR